MAKRSDFAQKLLDDLRQRKERLASSSQSSNRSNNSSMAIIDAYSYAKQNYRGSKDVRTNDTIGTRTGNTQTKPSISNRSSFGADSSHHIVPYNNGRAQSSRQMGELSMALAFALENGAKIKRTDSSTRSSMLGFLQQIGTRPVDPTNAGRPGRSASQFPAFSQARIEEISQGAQRLNQILRACSTGGLNLDQYSIQIAKELLKGAVDLENSLKMLANLQEASEFSVKPRRKNRIKLLDEGEDEEEEETGPIIAQDWRLARPRFSFDKADSHGSRSHSRSASFSSNSKASPEKARIPNVIAKLMGLENLPEAENSVNSGQRTSGSKSKDEPVGPLRKVTQEIGRIFGHKAKLEVSPPKKQRVEAEANPFVVNTSFVVVRERTLPSNHSFEVIIGGEKRTRRPEKAGPRKERNQEINQKTPKRQERDQTASPVRKPKGSEAISKSSSPKPNKQSLVSQEKLNNKSLRKSSNSVQYEVYPNRKHQNEVLRERVSAETNAFKEAKSSNSDQRFSPRQLESSAPILKRIKVPNGHVKHKLPRRIDEIMARRSVRPHSPAIKEVKKLKRLEKLGARQAKIESDGLESKDQALDLVRNQLIKEEDKAFDLYTLKEDVRTRLREPPQQLSLLCEDMLDGQLKQDTVCEDQQLVDIANEVDVNKQYGSETIDIDVETSSTANTQTIEQTKPAQEQPILTESENKLKQILIKSQLFLNTAEALFNLEIPINVLDSTSHDSDDQNDNALDENDQKRLVLDCGYELMRRKGRRQELSVHPNYAKASIGFAKMRSFDGLVRELSKDFEKLRMYGRDHREGYGGAEEYLPAMQEIDVYGREPDVNCMWDLGWSESVFAFVEVDEVVKDTEKFVLNALLDEIAGDLFLHVVFA